MKSQNRIVPSAQLKSFVCLLFMTVLLTTACSRSPQINETARKEAEAIAEEATVAYKDARRSVSLDNKYSWEGAIEINDEEIRNEKFTTAAKGLQTARDKFLEASNKMKEALNGQKAFDNELATELSRWSNAYKEWSDMAEFERKTWEDAVDTTDAKVLTQNLTAAHEKHKRMNENVMSRIRGIG